MADQMMNSLGESIFLSVTQYKQFTTPNVTIEFPRIEKIQLYHNGEFRVFKCLELSEIVMKMSFVEQIVFLNSFVGNAIKAHQENRDDCFWGMEFHKNMEPPRYTINTDFTYMCFFFPSIFLNGCFFYISGGNIMPYRQGLLYDLGWVVTNEKDIYGKKNLVCKHRTRFNSI